MNVERQKGFPGGSAVKRPRFDPWVGKIPFRRAWQPTPVFLPGKFHGQRSLAGYSTWGHRESDTKEQLEKGGGWYVSRGQAGGLS